MSLSEKGISPVQIKQEMDTSYLDYAMSVIIGRALPHVSDGLKPVHRRVLYAMFREGLFHNKKFTKCAGVVGEVLKKYHPHGDSAVYDTLVRMAQPWNLRYPLVDGQGNFGSIDGDSAAAYRYTEARMTELAEMMLQDIDRDTVDFAENFDGSTKEPVVLPTRFPALLVNGSEGIAVGMATKIPPHNLREVIDACIHLIDRPETTIRELLFGRKAETEEESFGPLIQGPDFPTGGQIIGRDAMIQAYETGRGILQVRGSTVIEEDEDGPDRIVITEVPYQVNKARLVEKIADLVKERRVEGIRDLRDESNREGIRVVIEMKRDAYPEVVLNQLFKHSPLQSSYGVIMLSIVQGKPRLLSLKEMLSLFIRHRREVTIRRTRFLLRKAKARAHILEGLYAALHHIDHIIATIRQHRSTQEARAALMELRLTVPGVEGEFELSEEQAKAILDMRLQKLTGLEQEKVQTELGELREEIDYLRGILNDEETLKNVIKDELTLVRDKYGDDRRSEILDSVDSITAQDLIPDEEMVVTLTHGGYIKRSPLTEYNTQHRGGKGVKGVETHKKDYVAELFTANSHEYLLIFTNQGRLHAIKVWHVPQGSRTSKGRPLVNLIKLEENEKPTTVLSLRDFEEGKFVFFATRKGIVKKTSLMDYSNIRSNGLKAINLDDDDELIGVDITDGERNIFLGTRQNIAIRFLEGDVRSTGRVSRGVKGINLAEGNEVVSLVVSDGTHDILTVTENGYGKRTSAEDYRITRRGGKGIFTIKPSDRNGLVTGLLKVTEEDDLMCTTDKGKMIRIPVAEVRQLSRNTLGVRLFKVDKNEHITSVTRVVEDSDEEVAEEG